MSDSLKPASDTRNHFWTIVSLASIAIAVVMVIYTHTFMLPVATAYQEKKDEIKAQTVPAYGASEVIETKWRYFVTVDGKEYSCAKLSFQDIADKEPLQCEDGVLLEQRS